MTDHGVDDSGCLNRAQVIVACRYLQEPGHKELELTIVSAEKSFILILVDFCFIFSFFEFDELPSFFLFAQMVLNIIQFFGYEIFHFKGIESFSKKMKDDIGDKDETS